MAPKKNTGEKKSKAEKQPYSRKGTHYSEELYRRKYGRDPDTGGTICIAVNKALARKAAKAFKKFERRKAVESALRWAMKNPKKAAEASEYDSVKKVIYIRPEMAIIGISKKLKSEIDAAFPKVRSRRSVFNNAVAWALQNPKLALRD